MIMSFPQKDAQLRARSTAPETNESIVGIAARYANSSSRAALQAAARRPGAGISHAEKLVAFSCKRRWVLSLPFALRFLLATEAAALAKVLAIVYRTISAYAFKKARLTRASGAAGGVTIQRFGSAVNPNHHPHETWLLNAKDGML